MVKSPAESGRSPMLDDPGVTLPRVLGPVDAICLIVGSVIGSGIFLVPAKVASEIHSIGGIVMVWVIGGLLSAAGALTLAELGAMLPHAGGQYVYLREAYGRRAAFLFGWTEFLVVRAGSMATLAAAFGRFCEEIIPAPWSSRAAAGGNGELLWQMAIAVTAIATLSLLNVLGTRLGSGVQVVGTILKVGMLLVMIFLPFGLGLADPSRLTPAWSSDLTMAGVMTALVSVLWAYDGWVNLTPLAEEVREPEKNIPRALILGMLLLILLYVSMTIVYHMVLPMEEIAGLADPIRAGGRGVAAVFWERLIGPAGITLISLVVMASTFISLNGNALTGPRAYFAMARDGLFPDRLRRLHSRFQTPANAILAQGIWAILLSVAAGLLVLAQARGYLGGTKAKPMYDILYTFVIFGGTIFYTLAISSVFILRRTMPDLPRAYRTWAYPATPAIYVLVSGFLLINILIQSPVESLACLVVVVLGLPAYLHFQRRSDARRRTT
mgnify:CR=1 FL=1